MSERVILAYSGGLDTSVAISWIGKETGKEVVAVAIDLGQGGGHALGEVPFPLRADAGAGEGGGGGLLVDAAFQRGEDGDTHDGFVKARE